MSMQEKIDEIMDNFDFGKVAEAMEVLNLTWGVKEDTHIPDESELRKVARGLLKDACREDILDTSSGGFRAIRDDDGELELLFVLEHWETEPMEVTR